MLIFLLILVIGLHMVDIPTGWGICLLICVIGLFLWVISLLVFFSSFEENLVGFV